MKRIRYRSFGLSLALALLVGSSAAVNVALAANNDHNEKVIASFVDHLDSLDQLSAAQKTKLKNSVADPSATTITDGLLLIYPDYAAAIESSDGDDVASGIKQLSPLAESSDLFLAADASFYLARTLMNSEQFESAVPHLDRLTHDLAKYSTHLGDVQYYLGVAQAGMMQNETAIQSFMEFLQFNPDAAERLRVSAWRQVQELQAIEAGKLADVHQHMDFSRRRLELIETDQTTQKEQDEIVKMLGQLIKEQEKKECNSSCKNSKNTEPKPSDKPSAPQPPQQSKPSNSQQAGSSSNPNGEAIKKTYDDSPASPWSRLRDRSRDPANNAVKEKLPARYRDIVEKYYEAANGDGK